MLRISVLGACSFRIDWKEDKHIFSWHHWWIICLPDSLINKKSGMASFMTFVGLWVYDFFHLFQILFSPEIPSWLDLSSSQNAEMAQYYAICDIMVSPVDMADWSSSVSLLWCCCCPLMSRGDFLSPSSAHLCHSEFPDSSTSQGRCLCPV